MTDWIDEVLDGKPLEAEIWKIDYIENLLHHTSISTSEQEKIMSCLNYLTDIDADEILIKIKENKIHSDPKTQYQEMSKNGMFNPK
tara:strand:- start:1495 stop:1752 length:258 start_codon:yes stop_codon:yes gene_type:complete